MVKNMQLDVVEQLYMNSFEQKTEMQDVANQLKAAREKRKALREKKKEWNAKLESNISGTSAKELTLTELREMRDEAVALGANTDALDQLIATANSDGPGHDMGNGERHIYVGGDTDWGKDRMKLYNDALAERNAKIDDEISNTSDDVDTLSFQLQTLLNQSNQYMNMASGTLKKIFDTAGAVTQKF